MEPDERGIVMRIVSEMSCLSEEAVMEIIDHFCPHCGSDDPRCVCWKDA
ncbi:MAG: hypothetical protein KAS32_12695 [Candidatus Peribacteraceae bacterium]|nr:hypothetical protein [Candidatus Peribacteraceae bacterium]